MLGSVWVGFCKASDLHDFLLLGVERGVDVLDMPVGELLQLFTLGAVLVFADLVVFFEALEQVHAVAAHIAYGDAGGFGIFGGQLGKLLAALLVQFGQRNAQQLAVHLGIE